MELIPTVGSVVHVDVKHTDHVFNMDVKKVFPTYDRNTIIVGTDEKGEEQSVNIHWVTEIIKWGKAISRPMNIFRSDLKNENIYKSINYNKSSYCGPILEMVACCLSKLNVKILTLLNEDEISNLFWKDKPGFSGRLSNELIRYPIVNKKRLKKWVSKNYHRLVITIKQAKREAKEFNDQCEADYWGEEECYLHELDFDYFIEEVFGPETIFITNMDVSEKENVESILSSNRFDGLFIDKAYIGAKQPYTIDESNFGLYKSGNSNQYSLDNFWKEYEKNKKG